MYKKFFMGIAAMAAMTLVSCSSDDLNSLSDNSSKNEAISFDGYLGRSAVAVNGSRGSELKIDGLKEATGGFGVFGNYKKDDGTEFGSNLFNNEKVFWSSSPEPAKWTYDNTKYWPTEGHIDFLAYAPYNAGTVKNTYSLEFTVSHTITEQKDLLWAKAVGQTKANNSGANKVQFKFDHALSRLGYSVKLDAPYSEATITLDKITLAGSTTEPANNAFYKKGTIDLSTGNWSTSSSKDANYNDAKQNFEWFSGKNKASSEKTLSNDVNKAIKNSANEYLFVIPQDFSTENANADQLYVIVEYTIKYNSGTAQPTVSYKVYKQLKKEFKQGKAYTINLNIGLTPIEFNAEVNDWDPKDGESIDASLN